MTAQGFFVYFFTVIFFIQAAPLRAEIDPSVGYVKKVLKQILSHKKTKPNPQVEKGFGKQAFKIVQFLQTKEPIALISAGKEHGIVSGATFFSYRQNDPSITGGTAHWIKTGKWKALHVDKTYTYAQLISPAGDMAKAFFPKHPDAMEGDTVREVRYKIVKNPIMTPTSTLTYADLFEDPKADPISFELTEEGKERLKRVAKRYRNLHVPLLMIGAYTGQSGSAQDNQVESYQRALTIRHFLTEELGFEKSRVVAIGYGETEPLDENHLSGSEDANRRVVFTVNVHVADRH